METLVKQNNSVETGSCQTSIKGNEGLKRNKTVKEQLTIQKDDKIIFNLSDVDIFEESGILFFRIADIAKCIEYSSPDNWNRWFDADEIAFRKINGIDKPMKYMSESALYRVLTKCNVRKAKPFERWLTKEVIPSIRKIDGSKLKLLEPVKEQLIIQENEIIKNFSFTLSDVEIFNENHIIWFKLSDIVKMLDIAKSTASNWIYRDKWFDDEELKFTKSELGGHEKIYVSESALYRILNRSNSPKAKPFERWVTKEVIPSIRKTGCYSIQTQSISPVEQRLIDAVEKMCAAVSALTAQSANNSVKINDVDTRVSKIENLIEKKKNLIAPKIKPREHINMLVRDYSKKNNIDFQTSWNELYKQFSYRTNTNPKICAKNRGQTIIDYIDTEGQIDVLESVAIEIFEN